MERISLQMNNIQVYKNKIERNKGKLESLVARKEKVSSDLEQLIIRQKALEEAQAFIQLIAKETQEMLKFSICDIVNLALDSCFPNEYIFDIDFKIERGKTSARLVFLKNGIEVDPMDASGGGVVDVVSFALRLSAWSLGHTDNVIILDEPFRFLSKDLQPIAGEMMNKLCKSLGLQMLIVTHNADIIENSDRIFEVSIGKDGVSKVIMKEI
jgi:DNA repair exonuclease SbcCD ATPase subunit